MCVPPFFFCAAPQDASLIEAVQIYGRDWTKCAAHVGRGVTNRQCCMRYTRHVDPEVAAMKGKGPWTEEEVQYGGVGLAAASDDSRRS